MKKGLNEEYLRNLYINLFIHYETDEKLEQKVAPKMAV